MKRHMIVSIALMTYGLVRMGHLSVLIILLMLLGCSENYVFRGICGIDLGEKYDSSDVVCLRDFSYPDVTLTPNTELVACICIKRNGSCKKRFLGHESLEEDDIKNADLFLVKPEIVEPERIIFSKYQIEPKKHFGEMVLPLDKLDELIFNNCKYYERSFTFEDGKRMGRRIVVSYKYCVMKGDHGWYWFDDGCSVVAVDDALMIQSKVELSTLDSMAL